MGEETNATEPIMNFAEAYPPEDRVVNVANMRHLWVLEEPGHIGAVAFPTESFWKKGL